MINSPRFTPRLSLALCMVLPPAALMPLLCALSGVGYPELGRSSDALWQVVVPLEALTLLWLLGITRWAGWWPGLAQVGPAPALPRVFWLLPGVWGAVCGQRLLSVAWSALPASEVATLLLATALVGLSEELLFRGLVVWGALGGRAWRPWLETRALWASAIAFGLYHLPNAASGQDLALTGVPVAVATLMGAVFYLARRLSGGLALPVLMHWGWDFSTFALLRTGAATPAAGPWAWAGATLSGVLATGAMATLLWFSLRSRRSGV